MDDLKALQFFRVYLYSYMSQNPHLIFPLHKISIMIPLKWPPPQIFRLNWNPTSPIEIEVASSFNVTSWSDQDSFLSSLNLIVYIWLLSPSIKSSKTSPENHTSPSKNFLTWPTKDNVEPRFVTLMSYLVFPSLALSTGDKGFSSGIFSSSPSSLNVREVHMAHSTPFNYLPGLK